MKIEEREALEYCWYEAATGVREALAEEARADAGESKFAVADSLRISWLVAQRADTTLYALLAKPDEKKGYRLATDSLLEKCVIAKDRPVAWVPVVPQGNATTHLSWKRWVWLQNHIGVFGAHRGATKTIILLLRVVWWATMSKDFEAWKDE